MKAIEKSGGTFAFPPSVIGALVWAFLAGFQAWAETTKLTNMDGREIEAEILSLNEGKAEMMFGGKRISYPMEQLSEKSRAEVSRVLAAREEKSAKAKAGRMVLPDGQKIVPGRMHSMTLKATDEDRTWAKTEELKEILVSVSFPPGFDPDKPWPVFFVNDTEGGANAKVANGYSAGGSETGYVVLGAQAVGLTLKNGLTGWCGRGVVTRRALIELEKNWPAIMTSDWSYGGNSGGSKNCCYMAVYLYEVYQKSPRGFFISACNEMKMLDAIEHYKSDKKAFRETVFFVSSGKTDTIATPAQGKGVAEAYEKARLGTVHFEIHDGGHGMSQEHYRKALKWFTHPTQAL